MDRETLCYAGIMLFGVIISAISQIMLKKASMKVYESAWKEYFNPLVICAYVIFFAATFLSIYAYRVVPLSLGPIIESAGYFFVTIFGFIFFGEKISSRKWIALGMIVLGIIIFSLSG